MVIATYKTYGTNATEAQRKSSPNRFGPPILHGMLRPADERL